MKASSKSILPVATPAHTSRPTEFVLGVDGGGTKTRAVILDANAAASDGKVLGEGIAGPSNPLRVGIGNAASAIREAVDRACHSARVRRIDIVAAEVGLAGVKRADLRERMRETLRGLGIETLEVVTDADIALFGATGGQPGVVMIAGTGSICCGRNARGKHVCAGGWGPVAGDEGSGSWIARRGVQAVAKSADGRGPHTSLVKAAGDYFNVANVEDLATAIYAPGMTNDRIAGFARHVIDAAKGGDAVARAIVAEAGAELGEAAATVIRKLRIEGEHFQIGYVGGVFSAGELLLKPLRQTVTKVAPHVTFAPPLFAPAEAAAQMARKHLRLALAG